MLRTALCLLGISSVCAGANAAGILDVYDLARANDPRYKAARYEFEASEQILEQARAGFRPTVRVDLERTQSEQRVTRSENPLVTPGRTSFSTENHTLAITQPIFRKDVIERLGQARAIVRQANFTLLAAEQDLLLRVANAYLAVLAAGDSLALARAEREAVRRQLDLAQARLKSGLGSITNLYDATARFAVDQAREIEAGNKLADAQQGLTEITGTPVTALRPLRDPFPLTVPQPPVSERWVEAAQAQNYVLLARSEAVLVAEQEVERQRANYFPSLNLVGTHNYRDSGSTLFGPGSTVLTTDLTLRLTVPIYEGGLTKAQAAEASARHQKAMQERETEARAVDRQTRAAFQAVVSGVGLVEALNQSVASQQKALEARETGLRSGLFTTLNVLDAQRDLFLARRDYLQARYEYLINRLRLKQNAGSLSPDDLAAIEGILEFTAVAPAVTQSAARLSARDEEIIRQAMRAATAAGAMKPGDEQSGATLPPREPVGVEGPQQAGEARRGE